MTTPKYIWLTLAFWGFVGQSAPNFEQRALDLFLAEYWNGKLFERECTGMTFDSSFVIRVYADSSFHTLNEFGFSRALWTKYAQSGKHEKVALHLHLAHSVQLKPSAWIKAPYEYEAVSTLDRDVDAVPVEKKFTA